MPRTDARGRGQFLKTEDKMLALKPACSRGLNIAVVVIIILIIHVHLVLCVWIVPSVLWYCWLGLLTCKNRLPYNLYCVGGDVKHCSIQSYFVYECRCCINKMLSKKTLLSQRNRVKQHVFAYNQSLLVCYLHSLHKSRHEYETINK